MILHGWTSLLGRRRVCTLRSVPATLVTHSVQFQSTPAITECGQPIRWTDDRVQRWFTVPCLDHLRIVDRGRQSDAPQSRREGRDAGEGQRQQVAAL